MNSSEGAVWCGHVVTDGGEREEEDEGGGASGLGREAGSSMLVPTAWPLPVLGTPNPVITQNTQGLTGSLSQHHYPASSYGPCGIHVSAAILPSLVGPCSLPKPKIDGLSSPPRGWFASLF